MTSNGPPVRGDPKLSPRQVLMCGLVADGESSKQIAAALSVSPNTLKIYLARTRDRIVKAYPEEVRDGTPRAVILRWYRHVGYIAFAKREQDAA